MNKKKILIIIPYFIPAYSYGGPVKVAYDHAIGLIKQGFDVTVITTDALDSENRNKILEEVIDGIKIIRFKNISNYLAKNFNLYLPFGFRKWLKNNIKDFDIVHIHDFFTILTVLGAKFSYKNNIKYFIQPHGVLGEIHINSSKKYIKLFIVNNFKKIVNRATGIFALTSKEKDNIYSIYKNNNINILSNGLYLNDFKQIKKIDLHKKYNLKPDVKVITFLGRIQYIKGLDISLKILAELNENYKNWVFLIIGPDEGEQSKLEELSKKLGINDKIIWYGLENTSKKYDLLHSSDLFLFNSRNEGFGLTIIESIASKLPVLISDNCPLDIIKEYNVGEIVNNSDYKAIINNIIYIFNNKEKYLKLGKQFIEDNYDINLIINNLMKYYNNK